MSKAFIPPCREGLPAYCPTVEGCAENTCLRKLRQNDTDYAPKDPTVLQSPSIVDAMQYMTRSEQGHCDPRPNHSYRPWVWHVTTERKLYLTVEYSLTKGEVGQLIASLHRILPNLKD